METLVWLFNTLRDVPGLMQTLCQHHPLFVYSVLFGIIFSETGLLIGFFLPGDSLLFVAGLACVPGQVLHTLDFFTLNAVLIPAAIIGDTAGYWIGRTAGAALYQCEKTFLFRQDHLLAAKDFYEHHGGKTIILARFVPFIRTFAPVVAGIAQMPYRRFFAYNVFGGIGWILLLSSSGYFLGQRPFIRNHLDHTILLIIFVSLAPVIVSFVQARMKRPTPSA